VALDDVVADVLDVARARLSGVSGLATRTIQLRERTLSPLGAVRGRYYLRFEVHDRPGVLARLAGALGDAGVSIEQMVQEGGGEASGEPVDIVLLTHEATEGSIRNAFDAIAKTGVAASEPKLIRIQPAAT
jgi:homoserine dehydrogenase